MISAGYCQVLEGFRHRPDLVGKLQTKSDPNVLAEIMLLSLGDILNWCDNRLLWLKRALVRNIVTENFCQRAAIVGEDLRVPLAA